MVINLFILMLNFYYHLARTSRTNRGPFPLKGSSIDKLASTHFCSRFLGLQIIHLQKQPRARRASLHAIAGQYHTTSVTISTPNSWAMPGEICFPDQHEFDTPAGFSHGHFHMVPPVGPSPNTHEASSHKVRRRSSQVLPGRASIFFDDDVVHKKTARGDVLMYASRILKIMASLAMPRIS